MKLKKLFARLSKVCRELEALDAHSFRNKELQENINMAMFHATNAEFLASKIGKYGVEMRRVSKLTLSPGGVYSATFSWLPREKAGTGAEQQINQG